MRPLLPLSVSVITLNEEANLRRCLESVRGLASEIVVPDSGSTDKTGEIARSLGAVFDFAPWPGHIEQKNRALLRCTRPWMLCLDADEELSPECTGPAGAGDSTNRAMQKEQPYRRFSQLFWDTQCLRQNPALLSGDFPLSARALRRAYPLRVLRYWFTPFP